MLKYKSRSNKFTPKNHFKKPTELPELLMFMYSPSIGSCCSKLWKPKISSTALSRAVSLGPEMPEGIKCKAKNIYAQISPEPLTNFLLALLSLIILVMLVLSLLPT